MDEETTIINEKTRNERIKNFFIENKKKIISIIVILILIIFCFFFYKIYKDNHKEFLSNKYNTAIIDYNNGEKTNIVLAMKDIINNKDRTYSPLALYFLIDNNLISDRNEVNKLFDILINKTSLETEIKNLIIYKKGLFNADTSNENQLLDILKPLMNSKSIWEAHALYLLAEYFYSKNEKQKSKEFFIKIIALKNSNQEIKQEAQKRLNRDLSD
tara:strand:+ start:31 stop:675 length:645 start_codon:yes stop_codon:yes gene_type:complete